MDWMFLGWVNVKALMQVSGIWLSWGFLVEFCNLPDSSLRPPAHRVHPALGRVAFDVGNAGLALVLKLRPVGRLQKGEILGDTYAPSR